MMNFKSIAIAIVAVGIFSSSIACTPPPPEDPNAPKTPDCKLNSDGSKTCGYNCMFGSDGHWGCAQTPNGVCSLEASGSIACSQ